MLVEFYICQLMYKNPNLALRLLKGVTNVYAQDAQKPSTAYTVIISTSITLFLIN